MLPQHFIKEIRRVKIRTRRLAEDHLSGLYRSVFKGRGMDFADVRLYQPGDDVRYIDWNITARMEAPYVKEFKEEREVNVIIAVDLSGSGAIGAGVQTKRELAADVAACLAYSAIANGDKVGLVLFSDRIEHCIQPGKGRTQALRIIREILFRQATHPGTSIKRALNFINHSQKRRAIVFLLSDFLDEGFEQQVKVCGRRHDFIPIRITDPQEQSLPAAGWVVMRDAETGELIEADTGDPVLRRSFAAATAKRFEDLRHRVRRAGTELIDLTTDRDYIGPVHRYMEKRLNQRVVG